MTDRDGAVLQGAHISLSQTVAGYTSIRELVSAADGSFVVAEVSAGSFELTISSAGFVSKTTAGILQAGETQRLPSISLRPGLASEVDVSLSRTDIAEDQIKQQEQQRVFGVLPNYYVSYLGNALPLTPRQKFELAWKSSVDPVSFGVTGLIAGIQQADNAFPGYGQGATGYGRRYGANYADLVSGTVIGGAILPTLFKQDPRYFYKGSGGVRARVLYALATSVICKGDNGRWQTNYSGVLGSLAAGGLSNLYYPDSDRNGAGLTFRNTLIGTGSTAISNLFQEFLVRKLTPRSRQPPPAAAEIRPTSSKP